MDTKLKDPTESKLYEIDFSLLLGSGETISSPTVVSDIAGLTIDAPTISGSKVQVRISGGTSGVLYTLTVTVSTSASNTFEACVRLLVVNCELFKELLIMLRFLINDIDEENYTYTDVRLIHLLVIAAQYALQDVDLAVGYSVNVKNLTIEPDPAATATRDPTYLSLIALKAACITDQSTLRTKANTGGLRASLGPAVLDTNNQLRGFIELINKGPCAAYEELVKDISFGHANHVKAILSPFVSNNFDAKWISNRDFIYWR